MAVNTEWSMLGSFSGAGRYFGWSGAVTSQPAGVKAVKEAAAPLPAAPKVTSAPDTTAAAGLSLPTSREGTPIPYICGTVRVDSNILWHGNEDYETITTQSLDSQGNLQTTQVMTNTVDIQFGLCTGPDVHLIGIYGENNVAIWTGDRVPGDYSSFTPGSTSGIFSGTCTFYSGQFDQPVNALLDGTIIEDVPAFVGTSYLMVENGDRNQNFALSFEVRRTPNPLGLPDAINVSADGADVNLATMVIDFMTTKWNGGGNDLSSFNTASFITAATILAGESNFGSVAVGESGVTADDLISLIEAQADGTIFTDPSTGLVTFRLFRAELVDLNDPTLLTFTTDDIVGHPEFTKTTWDDVVNQIRVMYSERLEGYAQVPAIAQTVEVASSGGKTRLSRNVSFPLVCKKSLAANLAARELAGSATPLHGIKVNTTRKGASLLPADVILITWDNYKNVKTPYFVLNRKDLPKADNKVQLELSQMAFPNTVIFPPPEESGYFQENHDSLPPKSVKIVDAPWIVYQATVYNKVPSGYQLATPYNHRSVPMALVEPENKYQYSWSAFFDPAYNSNIPYQIASGFYPDTGELSVAIAEADGIVDDKITVTIKNFVKTINSPLSRLTNAHLAVGGNYTFTNMVIDDEWFNLSVNYSLVGSDLVLTDVSRARYDTVKQAHTAGAKVYIFDLIMPGNTSQVAAPTLPVSLNDDGSDSPLPLFRFKGQSYFAQVINPLSDTYRDASYDDHPGERIARPLRPHNTLVGANARSATPNLARSSDVTLNWYIRTRFQYPVITNETDPPPEGYGWWMTDQYDLPMLTPDVGQLDGLGHLTPAITAEWDPTNLKFLQYRVMLKDSGGTVTNLGNTRSDHNRDNSLTVTIPSGIPTGAGLIWVEAYNDFSDSSRYKDTLPVNIV